MGILLIRAVLLRSPFFKDLPSRVSVVPECRNVGPCQPLYRAQCDCCKISRSTLPGVDLGCHYDNRGRRAVLERVIADGMSVQTRLAALKRDFLLDLSEGYVYDFLHKEVARLEMAQSFPQACGPVKKSPGRGCQARTGARTEASGWRSGCARRLPCRRLVGTAGSQGQSARRDRRLGRSEGAPGESVVGTKCRRPGRKVCPFEKYRPRETPSASSDRLAGRRGGPVPRRSARAVFSQSLLGFR